MPVESATYINNLAQLWPPGTDQYGDTDNHIRLIKDVLLRTFPNLSGPVLTTHEELNSITGVGGTIALTVTSDNSAIARVESSTAKMLVELGGLSADLEEVSTNADNATARLEGLTAEIAILQDSAASASARLAALSASFSIQDRIYTGRVDKDGTAIALPTDWDSIMVGTNDYQVSHYLALPESSFSVTCPGQVYSITSFSFRVSTDDSFSFILSYHNV